MGQGLRRKFTLNYSPSVNVRQCLKYFREQKSSRHRYFIDLETATTYDAKDDPNNN